MSSYLYGLRNRNAPNLSAAEIGSRGALWILDVLFLKTSSGCPGCSAGDPVSELPERSAAHHPIPTRRLKNPLRSGRPLQGKKFRKLSSCSTTTTKDHQRGLHCKRLRPRVKIAAKRQNLPWRKLSAPSLFRLSCWLPRSSPSPQSASPFPPRLRHLLMFGKMSGSSLVVSSRASRLIPGCRSCSDVYKRQVQGVRLPLADLLIGVTALELGYSVATGNLRHFQMIPGLSVVQS